MWFYNFGLILYVWAIRLVAPRHPKARLWIEGRKDLFRRMREAIAPTDRIIWIHVASLGEFEQGRPIIEQLRKTHPEYKILLTFFSPSGYEIRKNYKGVDYIFYLPIDTPGNARRFLDAAHPEIAIFVKYSTGSTCSANCAAGKSAPTSCRPSSAAIRSFSAPTAACGGRRWSRST